MDRVKQVNRRKELRKTHKNMLRRELLVAEYVQYKYSDIYAEAVLFHDTLNRLYPTKHDLKKTDEFRV